MNMLCMLNWDQSTDINVMTEFMQNDAPQTDGQTGQRGKR